MITLEAVVMEFAEDRSKTQRNLEAGLFGSALYALRHFEDKQWYSTLIAKASRMMRKEYRLITGAKGTPKTLHDAVEVFEREAKEFLAKTKKPTKETIGSTAKTIAISLSTAAINAATEAAGEDLPEVTMKTWVSMEDERVRDTHVEAHGQTVPMGEKFTVGGVAMLKPGDLTAPPEEVINCRCIAALSAARSMVASSENDNEGVTMAEDETREDDEQAIPLPDDEQDDEQAPPPLPPDERLEVDAPVPVWGVIAPENIESGDLRMFATDSLRSRPLPLPMAFQRSNEPGHDSSIKVGNYDRMWRRKADGLVYGSGRFSTIVPEVDEVIGLMAEAGGRIGVSVDADDSGVISMKARDGRSLEEVMAESESEGDSEGDLLDMLFGGGPDEPMITVFESARIAGATLCHIPAFHEAFMQLGEVPEEFAPQEGEDLIIESIAEQEVSETAEPLAAAAFVKTEDGPGWLTHPVDTDRLRDYWTHGKGAALIGWGTGGDFNRCRVHLAEYVKPQHLSGYCANRHYDALGFWPGEHNSAETIAASAAPEGATMRPAITFITASGGKVKAPPTEWFLDPELDGPTPVTVTEDGRVFGHVATWGTCHIGFADKCVTPPTSPSNYAYFRTGSTEVAEGGTIPTGALTVDTGHADITAKAKIALAHYDNTGANAANVSAGEDQYGIWIAGAVNPYATEKQVYALRNAALSGDWREIGGALEMVAALSVNVPGFPIPRVALAASAGHQTALVAAGIVPPRSIGMTVDQIKSVVIETIENREAQQAMAALKQRLATRRMEALRARRSPALKD